MWSPKPDFYRSGIENTEIELGTNELVNYILEFEKLPESQKQTPSRSKRKPTQQSSSITYSQKQKRTLVETTFTEPIPSFVCLFMFYVTNLFH